MSGQELTAEEARALLLSRLARIEEEERGSAQSRAPVELQQDAVGRLSRMDAIQLQAMALAAQARREQEKRRIDHALERIEQGGWGWCLSCGEPIAPARLRRDPAAAQCIECASKSA